MTDFLTSTFEPNELKTAILSVKRRIEALDPAWELGRNPIADSIPMAQVGETQIVLLDVCKLGYTDECSLKDRSKMVNIITTVGDMLERPYDSVMNPMRILFPMGSQAGAPIDDFSVRTKVHQGIALSQMTPHSG